ncbi:hypothetical protein NQV17_29730 [Burkholderia sp. SCN-KJ]|nr:hypothetical protein [Burkholderia sp. SCN-KJ]MCR4470437.1 hypothetical protein [Burkholderia sp. SCN-KJ]
MFFLINNAGCPRQAIVRDPEHASGAYGGATDGFVLLNDQDGRTVISSSNHRGRTLGSAADYHYIVGFSCHRFDPEYGELLPRDSMRVNCATEAPISVGASAAHGAAVYFNS